MRLLRRVGPALVCLHLPSSQALDVSTSSVLRLASAFSLCLPPALHSNATSRRAERWQIEPSVSPDR